MSSVRRMVPSSAARRSASMPTLSGRRRVSGTAKHFGHFAANTDMTDLLRTRFFDIRPAPVSCYLYNISRQPCDGLGYETASRPDPRRSDNTLIFTKSQALG